MMTIILFIMIIGNVFFIEGTFLHESAILLSLVVLLKKYRLHSELSIKIIHCIFILVLICFAALEISGNYLPENIIKNESIFLVIKNLYLSLVILTGSILLWQNKERKPTITPILPHKIIIFGCLLCIVSVFTFIKLPYWDNSFTGSHALKYNTYVEPALHMQDKNTPFWNQKKYLADPITNPEGIVHDFASVPLLEWSLYAIFEIFPNNSIEWNTHLMMNIWGSLFLMFAFLFFTKIFTTTESFLITFLLAINPIINFSYFITVYDGVSFVFVFLSLMCLLDFLKHKKTQKLFWAGLWGGLGMTAKMSVILILPPITFFILLHKYKGKINSIDFLKTSLVYFPLLLLPHLIGRTSFRWLPSDPAISLLKILFWLILIIFLYLNIEKIYQKYLTALSRKISANIKHFFLLLAMGILLFFLFYKLLKLNSYNSEFLTDMKILFRYDLYKYMLIEQFKPFMTSPLFYLGTLGILSTLLNFKTNLKNKKNFAFSFLGGTLIYWIIASKVIFFHKYYTIIVVITFCIFTGMLIADILKKYSKKTHKIIIAITMLTLVAFPSIKTLNSSAFLGGAKESVALAAAYLEKNTTPNDFFISHYSHALGIYAKRGVVSISKLDEEVFKKSIQEIGFTETMKKYHIKYLITTNNEPLYKNFSNIFSEISLEETSYRRSDLILATLDSNYQYFSDLTARNFISQAYDIKGNFEFEKKIEGYSFFVFK